MAQTNGADKTQLYASGTFKPIDEKCNGCGHIVAFNENNYCTTYANPPAKWRLGLCNFATHAKPEVETTKQKVNPLKASKRAMGKRG